MEQDELFQRPCEQWALVGIDYSSSIPVFSTHVLNKEVRATGLVAASQAVTFIKSRNTQ